MTGTAKTEEQEFREIYGLDVIEIPTNRLWLELIKTMLSIEVKKAN